MSETPWAGHFAAVAFFVDDKRHAQAMRTGKIQGRIAVELEYWLEFTIT